MKKYLGTMIVGIMMFLTVVPINAASHQIEMDGIILTSDVAPEVVKNRIMVPLRIFSENLGIQVDWLDDQVALTKDDTQIILKPNSKVVSNNGMSEILDTKAYLKNNRLMVPIRFIAETFGCTVNYKDSIVTVNSEPLVINGKKINVLQEEYHMTMGGVVQQIHGNAYIEAIYNTIINNKGSEVNVPTNYGWWMGDIDTVGYYYKNNQLDFFESSDKVVQRYDIYSLRVYNKGYPLTLVHDVTANIWYLFSDSGLDSIDKIIESARENGFKIVISNTVV